MDGESFIQHCRAQLSHGVPGLTVGEQKRLFKPLNGEVKIINETDVACWLELSSGVRVKTRLPKWHFNGFPLFEGMEFVWYGSAVTRREIDTSDNEKLLADLDITIKELEQLKPTED